MRGLNRSVAGTAVFVLKRNQFTGGLRAQEEYNGVIDHFGCIPNFV
jgi:hypothetical protein